ncbi:hypothetical protein E4T56_gene13539 [Termitomyces sp. T112]|nr:hypothetical protein E4T56_gene13539 [Termitomyces sp. T112]
MSSLSQHLEPENQAQRAQDQALKCIDDILPVIINGEDITRGAREAVKRQIEGVHGETLGLLRQRRRGQFLGGLFAFFIEISRAKRRYKARIEEFKSATEHIKYEALQAIEREVAKKISQEGATELLAPHAGRLSNDAKRVANQIYKKSAEISGESSYPQQIMHHDIYRRIWNKDDIEAFERNQDQEAQANHLKNTETARMTSPQGLPPPPRLARKFEQSEVQDPVETAVPIRGNHRRQGTFTTFGSVSSGGSLGYEISFSGGSSGYEASSSGSSSHSHPCADSIDEDDLEDIDVGVIYNDVSAVLDMYHQDD